MTATAIHGVTRSDFASQYNARALTAATAAARMAIMAMGLCVKARNS